MQSDARAHVMSYAATRKQKERTIIEAAKAGKKVSRYIADTMQEKFDSIDEKNAQQTDI